MPRPLTALLALLLAACSTTQGPPTQPNDAEWRTLSNDYAAIETTRATQPQPPATEIGRASCRERV